MNTIYRVLLPLRQEDCLDELLRLAKALLPEDSGEIVILGVVIVPEESSLSEGALSAQACRQAMAGLGAHFPGVPLMVKPRVRVAHNVWEEMLDELVETPTDLLLIPWDDPDEPVLGVPVDQILAQTPCDLVLVRGSDNMGGCERILLPMRGGPHAELALRVSEALARSSEGEITVMRVSDTPQATLELDRLRHLNPFITRTVRLKGETVPGIVREAAGHTAIVMGATVREFPDGGLSLGSVARQVIAQTGQVILLVRAHPLAPLELPDKWITVAPLAATDVSDKVERWFASNTFNSNEFADLEQLLAWKQERNYTISLALPALNEQETVGNVITTIKLALMDELPLLDEIVLIDSNSSDNTRQIAAELDVPVYIHQEILANELGSFPGKGEALWKSLYVTKGDIIAWIDTDIRNIHPRFVYGLLGPLLRWDTIQYVKGFYRRPIKIDGVLRAGGGGRVTELVARPLLNLFFPELSGIVQPLSGEYAGRRAALEQLPFFSGYGVETGLLIDTLSRFGLHAIAQVDLRERIHHNQPLANLSRMSFAILQVFIERLEARNKVRLLEEVNHSMKSIQYKPGRFFLQVEHIRDEERPPMIIIPAYYRRSLK
jgi:glycosyltransferase involved in cell wall biosynthesis/nucleotide-binding universal stress UspA family protein